MPAHPPPIAEEARAEHVVGPPARHRVEDPRQLRGVVLPVPVEVDDGLVACLVRVGEAGPERRAEAARARVGDHLGSGRTGDLGGAVTRAVVHDERVHGHSAGVARDAGEHAADTRLLVARDHERQAASTRRRANADARIGDRLERPAARGGRRLDAEQLGDGARELEHRAGLTAHRAGHRAGAPDHERHRALAPVEVPMAADAAALAVIGHQDDRGVVEPPALGEEGQEVADSPVGLGELLEVLGVADAAHVAELVRRQQLQHKQVRVLVLDHPARRGHERVVDLRGGLHRGDRAHHLVAERVEEVSDAHQPAAPAAARERLEHRLAAHAEPRGEVGAHTVLARRGAREHRGKAHDRPRRVGGLHGEILGALAGETIDGGRLGLP